MNSLLCHRIFAQGLDLNTAVLAPRLYYHTGVLEIEPGFQIPGNLEIELNQWQDQTLYFGGTHSVMSEGPRMSAEADPRRFGSAICRS